MKKILTFLVPIIALVGGVAGGQILRPSASAGDAAQVPAAETHDGATETSPDLAAVDHPPQEEHAAASSHDSPPAEHGGSSGHGEVAEGPAWFTFPSQFFVPLMRNGDMGAMMIVTLTIETEAAQLDSIRQQEHRLRDALLRQLMIQANIGGFDGNFTTEPVQKVLREELLKAARSATDLPIDAVLVEDIARQAS